MATTELLVTDVRVVRPEDPDNDRPDLVDIAVNDGKIVADIAPGTERISIDDLKGHISIRVAGESADYSFSMWKTEYEAFSHP